MSNTSLCQHHLLHRPPSYLVRTADGTYTSTTIDRIEALGTAAPPHLPRAASGGSTTGSAVNGAPASPGPPPPGSDAGGAPPGAGAGFVEQGFGSPVVQPASRGDLPGPQEGQDLPGRGATPSVGGGLGGAPQPPPAPRPASPERRLHSPERRLPSPAPAPPAPVPGFEPSLAAITEAQKLAKTASSALSFEDVKTAVKYLNDALRLLTTPRP